jgi:predicted dehydrogenase
MSLTPEQKELGRRNFLRVLAGTPAVAALGAAAAIKGPVRGGPVRVGFIGLGGQGRSALLRNTDPAFAEVKAFCDVNPSHLAKADEVLAEAKKPAAKHYDDWKEMLQKEDLEAVILAPPLWLHTAMTVACLEAGKHVLCEKMMAWDLEGCRRMQEAAKKTGRLLEIGYQRFYNPVYQAAHEGIIKAGLLGDIYHARLVWHRNGTWRRQEDPPAPGFDASRWGYPTFDHLVNWRLYWRYSKGLLAELASHQVNISNWFFGAVPTAVTGAGGVYRFPEGGREVEDHVFATFEYPQGRTVTFSSIESNAFDDYYEMFMGTKGTLVLSRETEAYFFQEGKDAKATAVEVTASGSGPSLEASETRPTATGGRLRGGAGEGLVERGSSYRFEISEFCAAIRVGRPLRCGPDKAIGSAQACLAAHEAVQKKTRVVLA